MRRPAPAWVPGFFLCLGLIFPAGAGAVDLDRMVQRFVLKNGMTVLVVERHRSPTVSLYIRHRAGAVDERDGRTGAAHLLEHMMFKGTETVGTKNYAKEKPILAEMERIGRERDNERKRGEAARADRIDAWNQRLEVLSRRQKAWIVSNEIDRLYTENGAVHMNASTGQDLTTYHVSLPANRIELWARIEADRMTRPVFREFFTERDVVLEERRQRIEADPDGRMAEQFFAAAFTAHPYRRPIIGWPSDIQFLGPDAIREFLHRTHAPHRTVIAIVGDVTSSSIMPLVRRYFASIPAVPAPMELPTEEPPQRGERRVRVEFDARPQLWMGWHKPAPPAFADAVLDVVESILGRGRTSRLYRSLVEERGIAENVQVINGLPGARYPNLFVVTCAPRHPHPVEALEQTIGEELEKLATTPVSPEELEKTRNQFRADLLRRMGENEGLASLLSYFEALLGDYSYAVKHLAMIERIGPADIQEAVRTYLRADNRTVAVLARGKGAKGP